MHGGVSKGRKNPQCMQIHSALFIFIRIYFIRLSRLKLAKFQEYFKIKPEAEILKRI